MLKKIAAALTMSALLALTGCSSGTVGLSDDESAGGKVSENGEESINNIGGENENIVEIDEPPAITGEIIVNSREAGSGTRGAFTELFETLDENKNDITFSEAEITNSTAVMMTSVAGDKNAIGYISLGSLNDTVKALKIDGAVASVGNILSGEYMISRPFYIAAKDGLSDAALDFTRFIMSAEGQEIIEVNGYIPVESVGNFIDSGASGKIVVAGSSSVTPVMEKLREAYLERNASVEIEIQVSDSTTGMNSLIDGICDIGMASREIKDSEAEKGVVGTKIALDGIAVIVNNDSPIDGLTKNQVREIFIGEITDWSEIN
jgi:phosphate transport system substrate-binding protein